jgi:uncharacterized OB-fold protein
VSAEAHWRAALDDGRLLLQRGIASGTPFFPPRIAEPGTGAEAEWFEASGGGTVYSVSLVGQKPPAPPYAVVLVDLDDGVRVMSRLDGIDPADIAIGMRVVARVAREEAGAVLVFDPAR